MRPAHVQFDGAISVVLIFGICVFALASVLSTGVTDAHEPVLQSSQPKMDSSVPEVDAEPQSTSSPTVLSKEKRKGKRKAKAFQLRRQVVLDFVGQHFPEIQKSLLKWEQRAPVKFRRAVSRLEADVTHLRTVERKNQPKFELMVDQWKLKTQIEITIAKYARKENDSQLKERLSPLVEQMLDVRTSIAKLERELAVKRISIIDERLTHFENDRDRIIRSNLRSFQKSAGEIRIKQKNKSLQRQSLKPKASSDSPRSEGKP